MDKRNGWLSIDSDIRRAVETLSGPNGGQPVSADRAETICRQLAQQAYQAGRSDALMSLMTTDDVVERLAGDGHPRHANWVRRKTRELGLGWSAGRDWVYLPVDYDRLLEAAKSARPGRPPRTGARSPLH
jgi:hypothetical protein